MFIGGKAPEEIRFSCAYLFRIKTDNKYFLVKDEQSRNTYQPVGGAYKYYNEDFFRDTHAVQCTRLGYSKDLENDLRLIIPRKYVKKFEKWYESEEGRENPDNLYREFQEEVLDRISCLDEKLFETITYKFCGRHIEQSKYSGNKLQIRYADIVELIPTKEQQKALWELQSKVSGVYCFATEEEINERGCVVGNMVPTISEHTYKILEKTEKNKQNFKPTKRGGKTYTCSSLSEPKSEQIIDWTDIPKANMEEPFVFISYQSDNSKEVWNFCKTNENILNNMWLDRRNVGENWFEDIKEALQSRNCIKTVMFINKHYLHRSSPCYEEAKMIAENAIPHIIILIDIDKEYVTSVIRDWIYTDGEHKEKMRVFKRIFNYNDDTGHIDTSVYELKPSNTDNIRQTILNLAKH